MIFKNLARAKFKHSKVYKSLQNLVFGKSLHREEGASFAKKEDIANYLSPRNQGILIDGKNLRFTRRVSYQNFAVYGVTGKGKSTALARPIILDKAKRDEVIIVNDMKGELFESTSGYMKANGYRIIVLNPNDLENSNRFNPFLSLDTPEAIMRIAQLFSKNTGDGGDQFWAKGAERYIRFFLKCLGTMPDVFNAPHNLYHLLTNFGNNGEDLIEFVEHCVGDNPMFQSEWNSLITGAEETISGLIINATVALKIFAEEHVCALTCRSDFDIHTIRKQKTIVYIITPPEDQDIYEPLISLYFLSFIHVCKKHLPKSDDLPVTFVYDEFGNSFLPNFSQLITTTRAYDICFFLLMQGQNQLIKKYGRNEMNVILSGIATQISFGGAEDDTASFFEKRAGKIRVYTRHEERDPHIEQYSERNLMNYSQIRELDDNKLLIISDNRKTTVIPIYNSHESPRFLRMMKYPPAFIEVTFKVDRLVFVPI